MKPLSLSVITLLISSTFLAGCDLAESAPSAQKQARPVKLMIIGNEQATQTRIFPARVAANQQANLAFRVSGELVALDLTEGQIVKEGQLLAQLDSRDAHNALLDAEANYELAAVDFDRKKEIYRRKLISKAEYDIAKATLKSTKAALANARNQLDYTQLYAPFSGIVAKVEFDNHQMVQPAQVVVSLLSEQLLDVQIQVPESFLLSFSDNGWNSNYMPKVRFGNRDTLYPVSYKEHSSKVSPGTQTYEMVFSLERPKDLNLLPGMSAELLLDMSELHQEGSPVIAVLPPTAIFRSDETQATSVWRYNPSSHKLESVEVAVGKVRNDGIEILSGIAQGDQIVTTGANVLKPDMDVKPLRWERGV
ncbi:efflux RND transporter periplasmic adaptor subunit [Vibrio astriarenae]|uniref:efflux RND transporter periplasmic adaptor subunit n=1 Tax=Vibrio astriarenae TaxID=1481923 RepID=UPI0037351EC4